MNKKTVFNFSNIFPHYSKPSWLEFINSSDYKMYFGFDEFDKRGIKLVNINNEIDPIHHNRFFKLKNIYVLKSKLIFQFGVIIRCLFKKFDVAIFLGDMKILSTWVAALICRFRRIEVVFATHGIYGNESKIKLFVRLLFYRLANKLLVYENRSKRLLVKYNFSLDNIYIFFNSLNYDFQTTLYKRLLSSRVKELNFFEDNTKPTIIFIGRLTSSKKINLLINAVINLKFKYNLLIVGDGPEREKLKKLSNDYKNHIFFHGAVYDEVVLSKLIFNSSLCVSPGNVGLTAVQSLSYGTPVITHNNFNNQMPESEIIKDGFNGGFFKENDVRDLTIKIDFYISKLPKSDLIQKNCRYFIEKNYNPKNQSKILSRLIFNQKPEF